MIKQLRTGLRRFRRGVIPLLLVTILPVIHAMTGREKLVTDHSVYLPNETIKVAFTNGPAHSADWIGIYKEGEIPGRVNSTTYLYVGGGSSPTTALANGEVSFTSGLSTPGNYVAFLLEDDGYRVLAQDAFSVIDPAAPQLRADKQVYQKSEKITFTFARGPGNAKDWIGIYHEGVTPSAGSTAYKYVDNTTVGNTGLTDGVVTFDTGLAIPGKWVAYLLENDDYTVLAQESFEVVLTGNSIVTLTPDHQHYLPNDPIQIAFDGGPGNPTDWIGVYKPGQRPGPVQSTDWRYVGGTQTAGAGLTSGTITLDNGLSGPQPWVGYFMLLDAYTIAGNTAFDVLDFATPIVQTDKTKYDLGQSIAVSFRNAPGNAKDWIGIYPKGVDPGGENIQATLWNYTDGTRTGTAGIGEAALTFDTGLNTQDVWTAYLFENDTYNILAHEDFTVKASGILPLRIASVSPDDQSTSGPAPALRLVLENRDTTLDQSSLSVKFDDATVPATITPNGSLITITTAPGQVLSASSQHTFAISFKDSAGANYAFTNHFTIAPYLNLTLPQSLYLETFDYTAEGSLPTGWTATNSSGTVLDPDGLEIPPDLHHLGSQAYNNFVVVSSSRLGGDFLTYGDSTPETAPIAQILEPGAIPTVVNGSVITQYANGNILLGVSGYHGAVNEILEILTPDYVLADKQNIYISFHTLLEQNQDSIEGIEVSNDAGATWHPVVYYLDPPDIIKVDNTIDPDQTFNTPHSDVALFPDGSGGTYGSFLKAPIDAAAAAAIQPRLDNSAPDGTRVEYIRVPEADNKASVRFRIFYAGTDSWYFGLDDFGIYVINPIGDPLPITIDRLGAANIIVNYDPAATLEFTTELGPNANWTTVTGAANGTYTTTPAGTTRFFRYKK